MGVYFGYLQPSCLRMNVKMYFVEREYDTPCSMAYGGD